MTRSWNFALTDNTKWYSIWDLIAADASFTDPTFSTANFVPSLVAQLTVSAATQIVTVSEDDKHEVGSSIPATTGVFSKTMMNNAIDLKSMFLKPAASGTVGVSVTAL